MKTTLSPEALNLLTKATAARSAWLGSTHAAYDATEREMRRAERDVCMQLRSDLGLPPAAAAPVDCCEEFDVGRKSHAENCPVGGLIAIRDGTGAVAE